MKKSELTQIIREAVDEVLKSMDKTNESSPPNFPEALKKKLISKYGKTPKAYATMWTLSKKMNEGDERVKEMWMQWENKQVDEEDVDVSDTEKNANSTDSVDQETPHDETDLSNPEEKEEVELARQIKSLADELLSMHGANTSDSEDNDQSSEDDQQDAEPSAEEKPVSESKRKKKKSVTKKNKTRK